MNTELFLFHCSHPSTEETFFNHSLRVMRENDTQENLEMLQECMKHVCGSCLIVKGEIIGRQVK